MTEDIDKDTYSELRSTYQNYIDSYTALYQLKTDKEEEELNTIYKMIKTNLIDSKMCLPKKMVKEILNIIPCNNRYTYSYLKLVKFIFDDYHVTGVTGINQLYNFLFYKEYGINLCNTEKKFEISKNNDIDIHSENTIYRAIMDDNKEKFIIFTEAEGFDKDQKINSSFFPISFIRVSLLDLCCYYGAVDCFKLLRTKFKSEITQTCLDFSFLGGNKEIMSECLKYRKPNENCMSYAIISHNIDFVTFLMNEYNLEIDLHLCGCYNNLESFLVYFDQFAKVDECFIYSGMFNIPSLCEYFLSNGANINAKDRDGITNLHFAVERECIEIVEFLISRGANINEKDNLGKSILHYTANNFNKELAELLLSHGANVNEKDDHGRTSLYWAVYYKNKEIVELLQSHGATIP
ncbi:hypothetical protein TVAG_044980 [Trichomonas vaginalis G3]|uniref:DUF3447 domain-containing protein n=1 Tax=Trichomonas vaginalis (strain ATCC PRA-98 / G3) TaxID=412133 RepID=A2E8E6_TRIV3|nr:proteasome regulatory particle assembly [Trichomonas vaginalis G3]EAY11074.1 hypothetical protein TVAG_044980 [Trichomonas vaginalis G3]KAI5520489.1 proteasome regulatory particle assembly [Trichomonas vaginalis G3]|eukprot:XP_001323297.1 hypothetical protein [Trichomonas vaginalis G3]